MTITKLKNISTAAGTEFTQFLLFFEKLSAENKAFIVQLLNEKATPKKQKDKSWENLKGSVLTYIDPFEQLAVDDWEVMS
ncbi:MAG: hypothetical protein ACKVT2_05375 [Saprospiraceae bacterium]